MCMVRLALQKRCSHLFHRRCPVFSSGDINYEGILLLLIHRLPEVLLWVVCVFGDVIMYLSVFIMVGFMASGERFRHLLKSVRAILHIVVELQQHTTSSHEALFRVVSRQHVESYPRGFFGRLEKTSAARPIHTTPDTPKTQLGPHADNTPHRHTDISRYTACVSGCVSVCVERCFRVSGVAC